MGVGYYKPLTQWSRWASHTARAVMLAKWHVLWHPHLLQRLSTVAAGLTPPHPVVRNCMQGRVSAGQQPRRRPNNHLLLPWACDHLSPRGRQQHGDSRTSQRVCQHRRHVSHSSRWQHHQVCYVQRRRSLGANWSGRVAFAASDFSHFGKILYGEDVTLVPALCCAVLCCLVLWRAVAVKQVVHRC